MSASHQELPRPFGPYELVRRLASGAVVDVYLAQARSVAGFQKAVAIKMIRAASLDDDPEFVRQLVEEANIASQLSHKNIVQVIDLGEIEQTHYIAMEYVDGVDLAKLLSRLGTRRSALSPRVAAYVMREIALGLDYAHRKTDNDNKPLRIVHRDVSPPNILLSFSGEVKLTDFGLAKASLRAAATQAGQIKGKYAYMAPEQARGQAVDGRTDVFAAGLLLYELSTGRPAYPDAPLPIMLERLTRGIFEPAEKVRADLPQGLTDIIRRATAADLTQRHPSARALADDLTSFLYTQDPQPETELAQLLEFVSESARSHLAPMGAPLIDDAFDEVTSLEAKRAESKQVATTAMPPAGQRAVFAPPVAAASVKPPQRAEANVARVRHAPGRSAVDGAVEAAPAAVTKPLRTPPPAPAVRSEMVGRETPSMSGLNAMRAPSLPGPMRPPPARAVPMADENPTEVMLSEGPDAELLATAAAIAPAVQRAVEAPVVVAPESVVVTAPVVTAPVVTAPPVPAVSLKPPVHSVRPPPPPAAAFRSSSPDVTSPHRRAPAPVSEAPVSQAPIFIAVGVGMLVGVAGAVLLVVFER